MTIHYPDVSNYQACLSLAGAVACIAKATEGVTFNDRSYSTFKAQALAAGIPFAAYHWLHAYDVPAQARHAYAVVGPATPLMIDDEDTGDGLSIPRTLQFVQAYRALGGTVTLEYLPRWFWAGHGAPDLRPLAAAGLSIVSSNYTAYSDTGPGWNPYGGVTPAIWQYTSTLPFNGYPCDFNAFKGTVTQLRALFHGRPVPGPSEEDDTMRMVRTPNGSIYVYDGYNATTHQPYLYPQTDPNRVQEWVDAGVPIKQINHELTAAYWDWDGVEPALITLDDATMAKLLAGTAAAAKAGAEAGAPTQAELEDAAQVGAERAEDQ